MKKVYVISLVLLLSGCLDKGDSGQNGSVGVQGARGDAGPAGASASKGDTGERGLPGLQGTPGVSGAQGLTGERGPKGDRGEPGIKGDKGECVPVDNDFDDAGKNKVFICHKTPSGKYKTIRVSEASALKHLKNHNDTKGVCYAHDIDLFD